MKYELLLKNGLVVDPANKLNGIMDLAISKGKIVEVNVDIARIKAEKVVDLVGKIVVPGIIDSHTHIRNVGHRNMAKVGVTTAVDVAAPIQDILYSTKNFGTGMNVACITSIHHAIKDPYPSKTKLIEMMDDYLSSGALGVKIIQEPLPHETILDAIEVANEKRVFVKLDCGVTYEGSNINGLRWIIGEIGNDLNLEIAHVNSYCRGQIKDPIEEALEVIKLLEGKNNIQSESYFGVINSTSGNIIEGIPENECTRDCLRLKGYPMTEQGLKKAILEDYCKVPIVIAGESVLLTGSEALTFWQKNYGSVCFPVNVPSVAILLATRKDKNDQFVIDTFVTDGGSTPRNLIVDSGLALVKYGALTLEEFVHKSSFKPSRNWGMLEKGTLSIGADADITVLDPSKCKAVMGIAMGKIIMINGIIVGKEGTIITTKEGTKKVEATRLAADIIDLNECGLYIDK